MAGRFFTFFYSEQKQMTRLRVQEMKNKLIAENGSIQNIAGIPDDLKQVFALSILFSYTCSSLLVFRHVGF